MPINFLGLTIMKTDDYKTLKNEKQHYKNLFNKKLDELARKETTLYRVRTELEGSQIDMEDARKAIKLLRGLVTFIKDHAQPRDPQTNRVVKNSQWYVVEQAAAEAGAEKLGMSVSSITSLMSKF